MRRLLLALLCAVVLLGLSPGSASAYRFYPNAPNGQATAFGNSAILNPLDVCFEGNTWVHTYRFTIMEGMKLWAEATQISYDSQGASCTGAEIKVLWTPLWPCADGAAGVPVTLGIYYTRELHFNSNCGTSYFYWQMGTPVPDGKIDIYSLAAHETGHVLGLDHTGNSSSHITLMSGRPEDPFEPCNAYNGQRVKQMAHDDATGIRNRYPGVPDTFLTFGTAVRCWD